MKTFRNLITEASKPKARVILFGRMNPITRGHEENVEAAHRIAQKHGADLHVIASHSHDAKKNPLSAEQKTTHMKRAFGHLSNTELKTSSKEAPTILHHAAQAHAAGVKHLVIAGGGDRAASYHKLLHDYNGVKGKAHGHYHFDKISIENTGERKEGVSGTDMRKHASGGHFDKFRAGLPSKIAKNEKHSQEMYNHVRHGMGVKEDTRDSYISGHHLQLGESVMDMHTGMIGQVVYRGPTYVTIQIDEDTSFKRWIADVDSLLEPEPRSMLSLRDMLDPMDEAKKPKHNDDDLSDKDVQDIESSVDKLEWDHVKHLFADNLDEDWDLDLDLDEALSAAQRIKKRFEFLKTKSKREIANKLARHRVSTTQRMKKRAVVHARTLIMSRLLRGRNKSQLSPAEKDRIENIVRRSKQAVVRISNRLLPKLRQLEMKRLKQVHEAAHPNQATDAVYDGEEHSYETTTTPGTDTTGNERLSAFKSHLSGQPTQDKGVLDDAKHMRKIRHFRKMEV